jgi:hypothetical protein
MIDTTATSNSDSDKTTSLVDRYLLVIWARMGMSIFASSLLMSVQVIYAPEKLVTNYDGSLTWKRKPPPSVPISMSYSKSSILIYLSLIMKKKTDINSTSITSNMTDFKPDQFLGSTGSDIHRKGSQGNHPCGRFFFFCFIIIAIIISIRTIAICGDIRTGQCPDSDHGLECSQQSTNRVDHVERESPPSYDEINTNRV